MSAITAASPCNGARHGTVCLGICCAGGLGVCVDSSACTIVGYLISDGPENFKDLCPVNHAGASGEIESKGAIRMFLRSVEKRNLKCVRMVDNGDTGCYGKVCDALRSEYGESYVVAKEECIGHVQKRMGTS